MGEPGRGASSWFGQLPSWGVMPLCLALVYLSGWGRGVAVLLCSLRVLFAGLFFAYQTGATDATFYVKGIICLVVVGLWGEYCGRLNGTFGVTCLLCLKQVVIGERRGFATVVAICGTGLIEQYGATFINCSTSNVGGPYVTFEGFRYGAYVGGLYFV